MRKAWLPLVLALVAPLAARGETIYAAWIGYGTGGTPLTRFDSETPWLLEEVIPAFDVTVGSLEFDPVTRLIWSFEYWDCASLCPPLLDPSITDPFTGSTSLVHLPGLNLHLLLGQDPDIDPLTRELRYFNGNGGNFSYSLDRLEVRTDDPLNPPFFVSAVAHKPPIDEAGGVETYVIGGSPGRGAGNGWYHLARIGGPGGDPPASSGEVTLIGPVDVEAERLWFDISANGTAYIGVLIPIGPPWAEELKLFRVDLESGVLTELGFIAPPAPGDILLGITVAPPGLGAGALEIPSLSPRGLAILAVALGLTALLGPLRRTRRLFPERVG